MTLAFVQPTPCARPGFCFCEPAPPAPSPMGSWLLRSCSRDCALRHFYRPNLFDLRHGATARLGTAWTSTPQGRSRRGILGGDRPRQATPTREAEGALTPRDRLNAGAVLGRCGARSLIESQRFDSNRENWCRNCWAEISTREAMTMDSWAGSRTRAKAPEETSLSMLGKQQSAAMVCCSTASRREAHESQVWLEEADEVATDN